MSNLLFDRMSYVVSPIKITDGEVTTEHHALVNQWGQVLSYEEVQEILAQIRSFYSIEGVEELIRIEKKKSNLRMDCEMRGNRIEYAENGLYKIPEYFRNYKPFSERKSEKPWSCKCGLCGTKISSEVDEGYYSLHNETYSLHMERACSEECAKVIWKDAVKDWIHTNGYDELFDLQEELK